MLDPQQGQIIRRVNITAPITTPEQTDGFSLGTLPTWLKTQLGGAVDGKSDYLFARGIITQDIIRYTPQGKPIAERIDRGVWSAQQRYYYEAKNTESGVFKISRVWLDGTLYELAPRGNGNTRPSPSNTNWNIVQPAPRNGQDGKNGRDGAKGDRGTDGKDGRDGEKGKDGKNGANGLTTQPNILREANLPSNTTAWSTNTNKGGDARHEPNITPPINGAEVWSCNATTTAESYGEIHQSVQLIKGKTYTLSVYAKGAQSGWLIGWPIGEHFALVAAKPIEDKNTAEGWQRFAVTFQARQGGKTNIYLRSWHQTSQKRSGRVYFAAPKLEESFEPTPWTRAQADFKGEVGARGAVVRNLGEWEALPSGFAFQSGARGEAYIDAVSVKENGTLLWWYCKQSHSKSSSNRPSVNRPEWELGQNLKFVATDILLAQKAFIDNLGVRYVESRNAEGKVVFSATDKGDVFIGGKATIAGFTCNTPITINPTNYKQYLEKQEGNKFYFSPFDIGTSIIFHGDFRSIAYYIEIYISNRRPKIPDFGKPLPVDDPNLPQAFAAQMAYLGTSIFVGNYIVGTKMENGRRVPDTLRSVNIKIENRSNDSIPYAGVARLDYQLPTTSSKHPENLFSIWSPTTLKPEP